MWEKENRDLVKLTINFSWLLFCKILKAAEMRSLSGILACNRDLFVVKARSYRKMGCIAHYNYVNEIYLLVFKTNLESLHQLKPVNK